MRTIGSRIGVFARDNPAGVALVVDREAIDWRSLDDAVDRLAAGLVARAGRGSGIALHLDNGFAAALLFLATARAGCEAQILDPAWPTDWVRDAITRLDSRLVVTRDHALGSQRMLVLEGSDGDIARLIDQVGQGDAPLPDVDPDAPFFVGLTSGSTGIPKAYRRTHRSWIESFAADAREFGLTADDVILAPGALTHSLFLYALARGMDLGATTILCRAFRPSHVLSLARAHRASVLFGVPTQLQMLIDFERGVMPVEPMRQVLSTGAKWREENAAALRRLFPKARFAEFYGASETSFISVAKDDEPTPAGSVGRAFSGVSISVRDDDGQSLPAGMTGHVHVQSPMLFSGYAFGATGTETPDGAICVGDIGHLDADGFLFLEGRAQRMMISSGKNLFPETIERALESHAAVKAAAVFALEDALRGERLTAAVCLSENEAATAAALIAHLRARLPLDHVPRNFLVLRDWPMTRSGKTDIEAVRLAVLAGHGQPLR